MIPNRIQKHICDFIIEQVEWWRDSNDIDAPTRTCDMECRLDDIVEDEGWISQEEAYGLYRILYELLWRIRKLKANEND